MGFFVIIALVALVVCLCIFRGDSDTDQQSRSEYSTPKVPPMSPVPDWEATWKPSAPVKASGECGPNAHWAFYEDGQLIITGSGAMFDYEPANMSDGKKVTPWYSFRESITSAKVGKGITHLGEFSFGLCKNMESVTLSCTIDKMPWACFNVCEKLREITIPGGVRRIASECFVGCEALREVRIPEGVSEIGEIAFSECSNLVSVQLPETLASIEGYAFAHCENLQNIRIPRATSYIAKTAFYNSGVNIPPRGNGN